MSMNNSQTSSSYLSFQDPSSITPASLDIVRNSVSGDGSRVLSLGQAPETSRHWRDVFWLVLFAFHFVFVGLILGVLGLNRFRKKDRLNIDRYAISNREDEPRLTEDYCPFYAVAGAVGIIVGCTWLLLLGSRANDIMKFGVHILTTYLAVISVLCYWDDHFFWAVAFAVGAVLQFLYVTSVIDRHANCFSYRLPYTMLILQRAVDMVWSVPEVMKVSCAFMIVMLLWLAIWSFGASGIVAWNIGEGGRWFLLAVLSVSLFWTGAVLCNVVHVIVSGMVFLVLVHGGRGATTMPPKPLRKYLQYAMTTSFGSICYGSLFTGAIRTLRWQIRGIRSKIGDNECLLYCVDFLFHLVETLVRFYNKYAYVQIAVYGTSFNHSARDAWELFQCTGIEALIAYDCSGAVLLMGTLLGGLLSGTSAGIWAKMKYPDEVMMVASTTMLMGMMLVGLATVVVESAVTSIYICYAEDPLLIQRWDEDFFNQMSEYLHQRLRHRSARSREVLTSRFDTLTQAT